ncbi:MAG: hypothetical protein GKR97_00430 [Rhizobiaceae bacterium]|nr:hypothetical protein [Rhizobiaceae bacterium]
MTPRIESICLIAALLLGAAASTLGWHGDAFAQEHANSSRPRGDIVLVRGGFNIFSEGLDSIAGKLARRGIAARLYRHRQGSQIVDSILENQKRYGKHPIILIGHSWGANRILNVARILSGHGLKVRYVVTIAATNPSPASRNIQKLTNYYFKHNGWGEPVEAAVGFRGSLTNVDMSTTAEVHHFNVDDYPQLQSQIINNVVRLLRAKKVTQRMSGKRVAHSAAVGTMPEG